MILLWAAVILTATQSIDIVRAQTKVPIDIFTVDYLKAERNLWQKIDVQQILIDRGNLLNEIYREHNRTLHNDIGNANTIISLSDNGKFRPTINTVRSIESHTGNVKEALAKGDYARAARLLKNSMAEIERLTDTMLQTVGDNSFWMEILTNV